ncbi:MAG: chaperone for outer membrane protein [Verrucomicrobia bacterium]|nr:MAG: chaperone for outer membrane protein [Verrucomicrobiota bacterium]
MKSRLLTICLASVAALSAGQVQAQQPAKIGLVDFARLQREFYRTDLERKSFQAKRDEERTKIEARRGKFKELLDAQAGAQKKLKDPTLSEDAKKKVVEEATERQGQLQSLQQELLELEGKINAELAAKANEVQKSLTEEIYNTIGEVANAQGFDVVLNRTFGINGVPTVAFSSDKGPGKLADLTAEVGKKLNSKAPAGWSPPKEAEADIKP